jgi:hypothetical protein
MSGKLAVTLTGRRPICDNEYECQANRTWLLVRQHADGRAGIGELSGHVPIVRIKPISNCVQATDVR